MSQLSRRRFLKGAGGLALAGSAAGAFAASERVVVVGAGLAGLAAAYDLVDAGYDVLLAEQSDRAGGRIKTVRDVFDDGAWVDVGGQTSGPGYANFFYFATLFELEFEPQSVFRGRPEVILDLKGDRYTASELRADPERWPVALTANERPLAPMRLLSHYLGPIAQQIGSVERVLDPEFAEYDQMSLRALLASQGASDAALALIEHTLNYNSLETVSGLSALRDATRTLFSSGGQALNIKNGNQTLTDAFANRLGDRVHYRHSLQAVEQSPDGVRLQFETKDGPEVWEAERVVLAMPFTALRKLELSPRLPAARREIIDELPYTQVAQTYLQTSSRFWSDADNVLAVYSDGPLERLFNASSRMAEPRGLLVNWLNGTGTAAVRKLSAEEQAEFACRELEKIWPESRKLVEKTYSNDWGKSYAEGAYAHYAPGQMTRHAADIPKPIGRLHFAGEHTELVAPGMEGALTSGRRAAREIVAKLTAG
ncbi:MAG: NAD(P)/FAD-dependent oxidoreductase [Pseudomonadota bacterium]